MHIKLKLYTGLLKGFNLSLSMYLSMYLEKEIKTTCPKPVNIGTPGTMSSFISAKCTTNKCESEWMMSRAARSNTAATSHIWLQSP